MKSIIPADLTFSEVGHLPIVKAFAKKIKLVQTLDTMVNSQMELSAGTCVLAMVLDTLSGRTPLYRLERFFQEKDTELLLGQRVEPGLFGDHNVARVLDKVFDTGTQKIFSKIAQNAINAFEIDPRRVHFDTTSITVFGDYEGYGAKPGSRLPERLLITNPAVGMKPMLVSMLLPSLTAARLAPFPRWARIHAAGGCRRADEAREFFHQIGIRQTVETVMLNSIGVEAARNRKDFGHARHVVVKGRVKTGLLRQFRMTLTEGLDQFDLAGQMIRVVWTDAMEFIQRFLRDNLRLGVLHPMNHPVPHRPDRSELILLFEPIHQEVCRRFVIVGGESATVLPIRGRLMECQIRPAQADAIDLSIKSSLQRVADLASANLMLEEPPLIVRMRGFAAFMDDSFVILQAVFFIAFSFVDRIIAATGYMRLPAGSQHRHSAVSRAPYSPLKGGLRPPRQCKYGCPSRQPVVQHVSFPAARARRR